MALEKRTLRIIIIVVILVIGAIIALAVGLRPRESFVHLEFIPQVESGNLIYVKSYERESVLKLSKVIDGALAEYRNPESRANWLRCNEHIVARSGQVCEVAVDASFGPCIPENQYSYHRGSVCVFLKLNKMYNWTPEPYNTTEDLPDNMPQDLAQHIKAVSNRGSANLVWVSCDGEDYADKENIGPLQYIPQRGFPTYYFPYTGQDGYLSPLIAVHFERPMVGVLIKVECKVWAKNVEYNHDEHRGSVLFMIMVD